MAINVALLNPRSSRRLPTVVNVVYLTDLIDIRIDCVLRLTSFAIRQLCNLLQQPAQKTNSRKFRFVSLRFRFDLIRFFRLTRIKCIYQFICIYIYIYTSLRVYKMHLPNVDVNDDGADNAFVWFLLPFAS